MSDFSIELSEEDKRQLQQLSAKTDIKNSKVMFQSKTERYIPTIQYQNENINQLESMPSQNDCKKQISIEQLEACFKQDMAPHKIFEQLLYKNSDESLNFQKKIPLTRNVQYPSYNDKEENKIDEQLQNSQSLQLNNDNIFAIKQSKPQIKQVKNSLDRQNHQFKIQLIQTQKPKLQSKKIQANKYKSSIKTNPNRVRKISKPVSQHQNRANSKKNPQNKSKQNRIELRPQKFRITLLNININNNKKSKPIPVETRQPPKAVSKTEHILIYLKKYLEKKSKKKFFLMLPTQQVLCRKRQNDITTFLLQEKNPQLTSQGCIKQQISVAFSYETHNPEKCLNCKKNKKIKPNGNF